MISIKETYHLHLLVFVCIFYATYDFLLLSTNNIDFV